MAKLPEWREAERSTAEFVERSMKHALRFDNRWALLDFALRESPPYGDLLEFGVFKGSSLRFIAAAVDSRARVFGFDSFLGLPETWRQGGAVTPRESFRLKRVPKPPKGTVLLVGWFEDTIPKFVLDVNPSPVFLHVDSDLYTSARTILTLMGHLIRPGAVIVFDEFFGFPGWEEGEAKALWEAADRFGWKLRYLGFFRDKIVVLVT
jgi:hypothetical protein